MALTTYTPSAADAQRELRVFPVAKEENFDAHNEYYATAEFVYKPIADEILALIQDVQAANAAGSLYLAANFR